MSVKALFYRVLRAIKSKACITVLGLFGLSILIWFGGPLIEVYGNEPLSSISARIATIFALIIGWLVSTLFLLYSERRSNSQVVKDLLSSNESDGVDELAQHDIDILRKKINKAADILKKAKSNKDSCIENIPWYILIGPPGSGKTTALLNSGLDFPLSESMGTEPISGVGGTRQCDWWFTDKAIMIDTAGRYTTQDSNAINDSIAWRGFLGLLKKHRPRKPINGAIVFYSFADLLLKTQTERNLQARSIKQRIQELQNQLGILFPVYVVFTKSDLVAGFNEYFSDLTSEQRDQVLGVLFDYNNSSENSSTVSDFNSQFSNLVSKLNDRVADRLKEEKDSNNRSLIFSFAKQLKIIQPIADSFLNEIFAENSFEETPLLRGVFLTSSSQGGATIDPLLTHSFVDAGLVLKNKEVQISDVKSYFIQSIFNKIVFKESKAISFSRKDGKKDLLMSNIVLSASIVGSIAMCLILYSSYTWNVKSVRKVERALESYSSQSMLLLNRPNDIKLASEMLSTLSGANKGTFESTGQSELEDVGLFREDKISKSLETAYKRGLHNHLEPILVNALESAIKNNLNNKDYLYETLKIYLMLFNPSRIEIQSVIDWFGVYIDRTTNSTLSDNIKIDMATHVSALLRVGINPEQYKSLLVAKARSTLAELPIAERAYQQLKRDFTKSHVSEFKLSDVLGEEGLKIFHRKNGASIHEGIPGLYTKNGYQNIFKIENGRIIKRIVADQWVYSDEEVAVGLTEVEIKNAVEQKYVRDYIFAWKHFLEDIRINQIDSIRSGLDIMSALSGTEQPIQSLIRAVQSNVDLYDENDRQLLKNLPGDFDRNVSSYKAKLSEMVAKNISDSSETQAEREVSKAFEKTLKLDDKSLSQISSFNQQLLISFEKLDDSSTASRKAYDYQLANNNAIKLKRDMRKLSHFLPAPYSNLFTVITKDTADLLAQESRKYINDIWKSKVLSEYKRTIENRYPVNKTSKLDITLHDFEMFFGYGGTLDVFFSKYLAPFVNVHKAKWVFNKNIGLNSDSLHVFQTGDKIRRAFFELNSRNVHVEFSLRPVFLDRHITNFLFELSGQELTYRHGPTRFTKFEWPNDDASNQTRIVFSPPNDAMSVSTTYKGEWSWFRMLDDIAEQYPESKKDYVLRMAHQGNIARLELQPDSAISPFWNVDLQQFNFPVAL